jgi:hypothetical protein
MDGYLSYRFKQNLFRAVNKFKQENPGVLEAMTKARKEREINENTISKQRGSRSHGR